MIRVRDYDVLLPSRGHADPEGRFREVHEMIISHKAHHVPAILCGEIQAFPDTIHYIKKEIKRGNLTPELHGWKHINYGNLSEADIRKNLGYCLEWFIATFEQRPSIFYTPWGANSLLIQRVAAEYDLQMVDCSSIITPRTIQKSPEKYRGNQDIEIFIHWWEGINRLNGALKILNNV